MASLVLLAYIIDMKYNIKYLNPLYNLMKADLLRAAIIQADETITQALNEMEKLSTYLINFQHKLRILKSLLLI